MEDLKPQVIEAVGRDDEQLLDEIAQELFGDGLGALPGQTRIERARRWLDRLIDERRTELCRSPAIDRLLVDEKFGELEEAVAIAGALAEVAGLSGSSLVAAAVLIARRGVRELCSTP